MRLNKNADIDEYGYIGFGIGFDTRSQLSWSESSLGKRVVIFGVDNHSSSMLITKRYLNS